MDSDRGSVIVVELNRTSSIGKISEQISEASIAFAGNTNTSPRIETVLQNTDAAICRDHHMKWHLTHPISDDYNEELCEVNIKSKLWTNMRQLKVLVLISQVRLEDILFGH
jgi:hypothetical protein